MRKLAITAITLALFFAIDIFIACRLHPEAATPEAAVRKTFTDGVAQILARSMKIRLTLPQRVDDATWLDDIRADGSKVIYVLRLDIDDYEFARAGGQIGANIRDSACTREDYRKLLGYGLTVVISLHGRDETQAETIVVTPQFCGLDK